MLNNSAISRSSTSVSSKNKLVNLQYRGEVKRISTIACFADLVYITCQISGLDQNMQLPSGLDPQVYDSCNWFNYWYQDAQGHNFPISNKVQFEQAIQVYANLSKLKISAVDNQAVQETIKKHQGMIGS